ncbi:MAG: response regulator [Anaerolineae bacterium]|nr:response regulator [Anaerolineae bacterium]
MNPSTETILIAEPDENLLLMFKTYFEHEAYRVYVLTQGKEVLDAMLKRRPSILLMETQMPDRSGLSVFEELKTFPRISYTPVIFMAGGTEIVLQNRILEAGAYDFVQKPVDLPELNLRIRNALRRSDGHIHPQTRLPTGKQIDEALQNMQKNIKDYYRLELRVENFDTFKDLYGFVTAKEVITYIGNVISDSVIELGAPKDFVGHRDESRFVVITTRSVGPRLYGHLKKRLDSQLPQFYNFVEREQGYVELADGKGGITSKPLMNLRAEIMQAE